MRRLLTTTAIVAGALYFGAPAAGYATVAPSQCGGDPTCTYDPSTGISWFDPPSFHVTSGVATSQDPVLLNNAKAFSIQDNNNDNISQPLTIFIATPIAAAPPVISGVTYVSPGGVASPSSAVAVTTVNGITFPATVTVGNGNGQDLYSLVGCTKGCDSSLNLTGIDAAESADGNGTPTSLKIYAFQVPQDFVGKDEVNVTGTFADGSIVFPFAENGAGTNKITVFDTSWTNTGFVDCNEATSKCGDSPPPPPPPPGVPEPSSIALLGFGLLGTAAFARRRRN